MWTAYEREPGQFDVLGKNCLGADASMRHGISQTRHFITLRAATGPLTVEGLAMEAASLLVRQ